MFFPLLLSLIFCFSLTFSETLITYKLPVSNELKKALGYPEGTYLNFRELSTKHGYISHEHIVTTEDGYILTIFRIKSPNCTEYKNNSVLLMHGIVLNADEFLDAGAGVGWPYLLADSCYDVWVGNHRGNNYARAHLTLNPDKDSEFWNFSVDEMANYDIPRMVDYILNETERDNLTFIGYSLGGNTGLITFSDRPEYNHKINLFVGLAPASILRHMTSPFKLIILLFFYFNDILQWFGLKEVLSKDGLLHVILEHICQAASAYGFCSTLLTIIDSYNPGSLAKSTVQLFFSHFFTGTSLRTMVHYGQIITSGKFLKYDFGSEGNLKYYGNAIAPRYNLTNVKVPTVLVTGLNDHLINSTDIFWLAEQLPNLVETVVLNNTLMNHIDLVYSQYIPTQIYPIVKAYIDKYSFS